MRSCEANVKHRANQHDFSDETVLQLGHNKDSCRPYDRKSIAPAFYFSLKKSMIF